MQRHRQSMKRLEEAGMMVKSLKFLVKIINGTGVRADPHKVRADTNMEEPTDVSGVIRFLGMVSHLGQYLPHLAEKNSPERTTEQKYLWTWGDPQQKAFDSIRRQLSQQPGLELYNPRAQTVSSDASSFELVAVLLQKQQDGTMKPVAYASRVLNNTEKKYAQIKKEALAITCACERFFQTSLLAWCFTLKWTSSLFWDQSCLHGCGDWGWDWWGTIRLVHTSQART